VKGVLVDTSVWVDHFRHRNDALENRYEGLASSSSATAWWATNSSVTLVRQSVQGVHMKIVVVGHAFLESGRAGLKPMPKSPCCAKSRARPTTACTCPNSSPGKSADDLSLVVEPGFFERTTFSCA
jgi:hypothetical protein